MKIQKIESQLRRNFYAIYECEHCGFTKRGSGYDDDNFHRNIIPKMKCPRCRKVAPEDYKSMGTKYPAYVHKFRKHHKSKKKEQYTSGYDWAAGALLRGEETPQSIHISIHMTSDNTTPFDFGAQDACKKLIKIGAVESDYTTT